VGVNSLVNGVRWIGNPAHWSGTDGIWARLGQHVELSVAALAIATLIALPVGLLVGHTRRGRVVAAQTANAGRAIPSIAVLAIAFVVFARNWPRLAFGFGPTVIALVLLGIPPILVNTSVGIEQIDPDVTESALGTGMSGREVLFGIEVPLAMPLITTGLRLAALQIVATATLSALIAGGTLGRYIVDGYAQQDTPKLVAGAMLVAALAIVTELIFAGIARSTAPRTRSGKRRARGSVSTGAG
jgi:osmoprotectant transport system permease protein